MSRDCAPVVVGIDGSSTAVSAALWAVDEAVDLDAPLRLVYVTGLSSTPPHAEEYRADVREGKAALATATHAVEALGKQVKVQTDILTGTPSVMLTVEGRDAALICVGSTGIGRMESLYLGSTATVVANEADCSVAIVRPGTGPAAPGPNSWVVIPVNAYTDNDALVEAGFREARLRHTPVLALGVWNPQVGGTSYDVLDRMTAEWQSRHPGVHVYPVATDEGLAHFLEQQPELECLVMFDSTAADQLAPIVGRPHRHPHTHVSRTVLVVRTREP
jgi:nucleotide-binding universal stress UspA family protein